MQIGEATIKGVRGRYVYYAEVEVGVEPSPDPPIVLVACAGRGFMSQGYSEDASAIGYDRWKAAARKGVTFATGVADFRGAATIRRITGFRADTNLTTIVVAAAHALWKAASFIPSPEVIEHLQGKLRASLGHSWDELPELQER